jgi:Holliday junction DNA helicase RuvA
LRLFKLIVEHIQGVGPKTAMNIFRTLSFEEIKKAIEEKDYRPFLEVKGLGEKTAKRIVLEIGGELFREEEEDKVKEVYQALINLGFEKDSVKNALKSLDKNLTVEELIKEGLKKLSNEKYKA